MQIPELYKVKKPVFSLEIFPPKKTINFDKLYDTVERLAHIEPDFISVTYGAGGERMDNYTCQIASTIKKRFGIETMAHLTCINSTEEQLVKNIKEIKESGIENVLALRGDINPELQVGTYEHANELAIEIQKAGGLALMGACYPEGHVDCDTLEEDIENLKYKIGAGVKGLITQLFFDNSCMYRFLDMARKDGIKVPVSAGIMPITNVNQIKRTVALSGASLPPEFTKMVGRYETEPDKLFEGGIEYAVGQIRDLIEHGIDGIHLYTMNNANVALKVWDGVKDLIL